MDQTTPLAITISRQLGCGGAYIGQQLAKKLNIYYADRDILHKAAEQLSVLEEDLDAQDEKVTSFWYDFMQFSPFYTDVYYPPQIVTPTSGELFDTEADIIKKIIKERSAVIIGRCGFHVLRDHPNCVKVFLHADAAFRNNRVRQLYNIAEDAAKKMIIESDKSRATYIHTFTGKQWTDTRLYDISIDTGKIGVEKCAEIILKYVDLM